MFWEVQLTTHAKNNAGNFLNSCYANKLSQINGNKYSRHYTFLIVSNAYALILYNNSNFIIHFYVNLIVCKFYTYVL